MIEKIGTKGYEVISKPCDEVIEILKRLKSKGEPVTVGEVGVGIGATSLAILEYLDENDTFYLFSYEKDVRELVNDLEQINDRKISIIGLGNSAKTYDSYSWNLAKLALKMRNENVNGIFDLIFLDGAHTFIHDAPACYCIKQLLKVGGYVIFDDMYWSMSKSPTCNPDKRPQVREMYTDEQIETCHIDMIVSLFMSNDDSFQQIYLSDNKKPLRSIWNRVS